MTAIETVTRRSSRAALSLATLSGIACSLLLLCLFSVHLFTIDEHYLGEIPLLLFAAAVLLSVGPFDTRILLKVTNVGLVVGAAVTILAVIGMAHGASFLDVYGNARAIMVFFLTATALLSIDSKYAVQFSLYAAATALLLNGVLFYSGLAADFLTLDSLVTGKVTMPIEAFIAVCVYCSLRKPLLAVPLFVAFAIAALDVSYRVNYVALALTGGCSIAAMFYLSRRVGSGTKALVTTAILGSIGYVLLIVRPTLYAALIYAHRMLVALHVPASGLNQIIHKTAQAYLGSAQGGDVIYARMASGFFDVSRFWFPKGLGDKASLRSADAFGGNTIDNTIIFFNYHFSIWVTAATFIFCTGLFLRRTSRLPFWHRVGSGFAVFPLAAYVLIRPHYFAFIQNAISLAIALCLMTAIVPDSRYIQPEK